MAVDLLVVDTDQAFGELIRQTLEATGLYRVHAAGTAADALNLAFQYPIRLAIVDLDQLDTSPEPWLRSLRLANPRLAVYAIPSTGGALPESVQVDGVFPKPFYLPDLPQLVSEAVGLPPEAARPVPFGPPQSSDERQSEPEPDWLSDAGRAQETLTRAVAPTSARSAALIRNDRLWAITIRPDSGLTRNQLAPLMSTAGDVHTRGSLTRFFRPASQKEDFVAYVTPVSRELALIALFGRETPLGSARRTGEKLVRWLMHPDETPQAPVTEVAPAPAPAPPPAPTAATAPMHRPRAIRRPIPGAPAQAPPTPAPPAVREVPRGRETPPVRETPPAHEAQPVREVAPVRETLQVRETPSVPETPLVREAPPVREILAAGKSTPAPEMLPAPEPPREPTIPAVQLPQDWVPVEPKADAPSWVGRVIESVAPPAPIEPPSLPPPSWPEDWMPVRASLPGAEALLQPPAPAPEPEPPEPQTEPVDMPKDWIPEEPMESAQLPFLDAKGETATSPAEPPPPPIRVSLFAVLLPRFPEHELTGELADRLHVWTMRLCLAWDWTAERIDVRPDRLEITLVLPPEESPAHAIQELRDGLSERVLRAFPELLTDLPSHRFWASSYLLRAGPPPPAQDVDVFIQATRRAQTGPLRP